jgi:serine/threonine protein kinase
MEAIAMSTRTAGFHVSMASNPLQPGDCLGKYKVLSHIATGGMGTVYKARDEKLGRIVALKVLPEELAAKPNTLERFRREACHAARLSHKNIVTLYDFGDENGLHFLVLEYIDGIDLYDYIERKGRLAPEESRRILIQAVKALDHAYQQGIIHRDIKPSNFLLTRDRDHVRVKLTDMGLARHADDASFRVTKDGSTVGTVDYLSPEQARDSASADIRSDIYSLGCTLYHMLAGTPPFSEGGLGERIFRHMQVEPPDVRQYNPQVSDDLWALLQRMLAKKAEDRFQTPADLLRALKELPTQTDSEDGVQRPPRPTTSTSTRPPTRNPSKQDLTTRTADEKTAHLRNTPQARSAIEGPDSSDSSLQIPPEEEPSPAPKTELARPASSAPEDDPAILRITPDHLRTAARQFERAQEARAVGNLDYASELLLSCIKLDPVSIVYRQALRETKKTLHEGQGRGSWLGSLSGLTRRARLNAARSSRQFRKVLEIGEELLTRHPADVKTQIILAEAAEELGLNRLAAWMLGEVRRLDPRSLPALRGLARVYEKERQFHEAIAMWEAIHKAVPHDPEAARKIKDLAVSDTLARSGNRLKR